MRTVESVSLLAVVAGLFVSTPASSEDFARSGFYLGLSVIGGAYTQVDEEIEDALQALGYSVDVDMDPAVGFDVYGGYRLHPHFALEAEFEMLPEAEIDVSGVGTVAELETWTLMANAKAFLLTGRAQPFLRVGVGAMDAEIESTIGPSNRDGETDFAARFGGGVDVYLTEQIVFEAGASYVLPTGDLEDVDYVSFGGGIQFRF
jgi:opacity protein-like surface antigen